MNKLVRGRLHYRLNAFVARTSISIHSILFLSLCTCRRHSMPIEIGEMSEGSTRVGVTACLKLKRGGQKCLVGLS